MSKEEKTIVTVESTPEGLYFNAGDLRAGPFTSMNEVDSAAVAQQLKVDLAKVYLARLRLSGGSYSSPIRPEVRKAAAEVGETFTYTGDRPFVGRVQLTALGKPYSRYMRLTYHCEDDYEECAGCPLNRSVDLDFTGAEVDPSAFASYFDTDNPRDALKVLAERRLRPRCMRWLKAVRIQGEDERAVTPAIVIDLQGTEGRAWFVHGPRCDLKRAPNWVTAMGWLCHGEKGGIGVMVTEFTTESEVSAPTDEELARSREVLRRHVAGDLRDLQNSVVMRISAALKRRSQLKGSEIVKGFASDLLTAGSPIWVKTPEGEPQLGATTCELGPTTTAKSQRERELITWLGAGRYHAGRMTEAGLTAGAEQVKNLGWILKKGLLSRMDLSLLILDNMPPHALDRQIESRRNGVVTLTAMKDTELWGRCRLKLLGNPAQPFEEVLYRCVALKVYDSKLIARFAFAVFTYGATTEERYTPEIQTPAEGDEELLDAARTVIRWNMSKERTYTTRPEHWHLIMELGRQLEEEFGCEEIPLLLRSTPYKLAVVAYPFALLEGLEEPEERHVWLAYEWLRLCAMDIELDGYVVEWRQRRELSDAEYEKISKNLQEEILDDAKVHGGLEEETETYRFIEYVARHTPATRDEVSEYIGMESVATSKKAQFLKGLGLLRSDREGYSFAAKGVRFIRRWLPRRKREPMQPMQPSVRERTLMTLQEKLKDVETLGVRLVKENGGESITTMVYYDAAEKELNLKNEEIQALLEALVREEHVIYPAPQRLHFAGQAMGEKLPSTGGTPAPSEEARPDVGDEAEEAAEAAAGERPAQGEELQRGFAAQNLEASSPGDGEKRMVFQEKMGRVSEALRSNRLTQVRDLARGVDLPVEEVKELLRVIQRGGHAFQQVGGYWRWQS